MRRSICILCVLGGLLVSTSAYGYELRRAAFSGGAVASEGGSVRLGATIGEAGVVGCLVADTQILGLGFWGRGKVQVPSDVGEPNNPPIVLANSLSAGTPNPFRDQTAVRFVLAQAAPVSLTVFDLSGRRVATLASGLREPGTYTAQWDGRDESRNEAAIGLYFLRLEAGSWSETQKVVKLR